jgi:hypothetical protein
MNAPGSAQPMPRCCEHRRSHRHAGHRWSQTQQYGQACRLRVGGASQAGERARCSRRLWRSMLVCYRPMPWLHSWLHDQSQLLRWKTPGLLRAVTRGVVPLRRCVTRRLTCSRCLPFLLASQTALTPSADPPGKPGLHHSHLQALHGRSRARRQGQGSGPAACIRHRRTQPEALHSERYRHGHGVDQADRPALLR